MPCSTGRASVVPLRSLSVPPTLLVNGKPAKTPAGQDSSRSGPVSQAGQARQLAVPVADEPCGWVVQTVPMSPVNRGRRGRQRNGSGYTGTRHLRVVPTPCDCPACTGGQIDQEQLLDSIVGYGAELIGCDDPLDAEALGASIVTTPEGLGTELVATFVAGLIPGIEARPGPGSLAILSAIGAVGQGQVGDAARAAVERLAATGIPRPAWVLELREPVLPGECWRLYDTVGTLSMLGASFRRAGRAHAFIVVMNHLDCGAAADIAVVPAEGIDQLQRDLRADARADGLELRAQTLDPAEFRWYAEQALDARAVHDGERRESASPALLDDAEGPGYAPKAALLRARLAALPTPRRPAGAHPANHGGSPDSLAEWQWLEQLAGGPDGAGRAGGGSVRMLRRGDLALPLPPKRKKSAGPAPILQIKVGLRGAKPPIWRRLLVPAEVSLTRLHAIIQAAFDWDDSHLHLFETPYGDFGHADQELGHRAEGPVTLEQVAPEVKSRIVYTYDFGDGWHHEIVVEKVLDRDNTLHYPLCTAGRRAAPPEDCGGIWGYMELLEALGDPEHEEREELLGRLGLADASGFDPAYVDLAAINEALSRLG